MTGIYLYVYYCVRNIALGPDDLRMYGCVYKIYEYIIRNVLETLGKYQSRVFSE